MKVAYSGLREIFDTNVHSISVVIIENQLLLTEFCTDIYNQIQGIEGKVVISEDDKPLDISKNVELFTQFIPFEINRKNLISKFLGRVEKIAMEPDYYEDTIDEMANLEKYLWKITENMGGNIVFSKLSVNSLVKASGIEFDDDYDSLCEKIIDYMELVREYDRDKLFIFINLRSFISDSECYELYDTILRKNLNVLMIENCEHTICSNERRVIVDSDCCEIK